MKFITSVCALLVILTSLPALADTANREQLLRFAKVIGIYDQIEEQKVALQAQGALSAQQYAQRIASSNPGLPVQFKKDMEDEMKVYMSNIATLIDTDFMVDAYIKLISEKLSAEEIQKLIEFYESDLGKKFTHSNTEVMGDWTKAFMGDFDKKMMVYLQRFTNNLMAKASVYNNKK
jgi:hypothetical protein